MKARIVLLMCLVVSGLVLVPGCGGGFPIGTFKRAVDSSFEIEFRDDGVVLMSWRPQGVTELRDSGTYSVEGSELVFETPELCGTADRESATYTWTFRGSTLALDPVGVDPCIERWMFVDTEWHLQSE